MTLIPLQIPPGFYRNGTDFEGAGRWRDGNLVRWHEGSLRPIGGWRVRENTTGVAAALAAPARGINTWVALDGTRYIGLGSAGKLLAVLGSGTVIDITPLDLVAGLADAAVLTGYGYSDYGTGTYGTARPDTGNYSEATTWAVDNFGENLVACSSTDGRLLEWGLGVGDDAAAITNAPINCAALMVTEERFLVALGAGGDPRKVQWCDQENNTAWTSVVGNQAGDFTLSTPGQIMQGLRARGQALIITDTDAHAMTYQGLPFVYGFSRVGSDCGAISRKAAVTVDGGTFWMGQRGFFRFDGTSVQQVSCDVHDFVFSRLNTSQQSKIWCFSNGQHNEIWWFYCSTDSTEIDSYVALDVAEGHWLVGDLARTCGISRGVFSHPILMGADEVVYEHEIVGEPYGGGEVFAESAPFFLGAGDNVMHAVGLIPDELTQGEVDMTFKTRYYPNGPETSHGPFTPNTPTSLRFTGRQARMRVSSAAGDIKSWRVGTMRLDAVAGGKR